MILIPSMLEKSWTPIIIELLVAMSAVWELQLSSHQPSTSHEDAGQVAVDSVHAIPQERKSKNMRLKMWDCILGWWAGSVKIKHAWGYTEPAYRWLDGASHMGYCNFTQIYCSLAKIMLYINLLLLFMFKEPSYGIREAGSALNILRNIYIIAQYLGRGPESIYFVERI